MPSSKDLELFAKKVVIVTGVAILLVLLWMVRDILILIFIAAVLAAGIAPAVHRVRVVWRFWFHRQLARGTAVMIVYLPFVIVLVTLGLILVPQLISDWKSLSSDLPVLVEKNILVPLEKYVSMEGVREALRDGSIAEGRMFGYVRGAATVVAAIIAILFMIAYMLIDAHRLRNLILLIYPTESRGERRRTLNRMARRMTSWLSAQLILAAIIAVTTFVTLLILRIPYALPLAILAGIGEMVPVLGPILGAIPALGIALLSSRWQFWSVLVFAILLQKIENLFVAPRVMASKVSVSPLTVFIAFMMGGTLLGIVGAIMAIPVAAILQVAFDEVFIARRERRQDMERAGTLLRRVD
ncbi:MAG: AI-2E family transporter [Thermoanaerobaculia bacterium]|nr:AI-2E family transporter [Thermoanaerobaculia bacterium]